MISMSNVTSVGAAGSYYASDNYYSRDENQVQSVWQGHGAEVLGLSGMVEPEAFKQVLSGEVGEQRLGRVTGTGPDGEMQREHRPGYDVTLSAPKSVSIWRKLVVAPTCGRRMRRPPARCWSTSREI